MSQNNLNHEEIIDFQAIFRKIMSHWKWFVLSTVFCVGVALVYLKLANPVYQVSANILIKQDNNKSGVGNIQNALMKNMGFGALGGGAEVDDEIFVVSSYTLFLNAVKELDLNKTYVQYKWGGLKKKDLYDKTPIRLICSPSIQDTLEVPIYIHLKVAVDGSATAMVNVKKKNRYLFNIRSFPARLRTDYGEFVLTPTEYYKPAQELSMRIYVESTPAYTELLKQKTGISIASKKSNAISLGISDVNEYRARDLLNKIIDLYNKDGLLEKNLVAENTARFLNERLSVIASDLGEVEKDVEVYKKQNDLIDIPTEAKLMIERAGDFKEKSLEIETQYSVVTLIEDYLKIPGNKYSLIPANIGLQDKTVGEALTVYNTLLLERLKLLRSSNESNPLIQNINAQADAMRSNLLLSVQSLKSAIKIQRKELAQQENLLQGKLKGLPKQEREFLDIKRQQAIKEQLFIFLMEKKEENDLALAVAVPKAKIIDAAYKSVEPLSPKKPIIALIALILGLAIPAIYLYLKDLLTTKFETMEDVERKSALPILGEIYMGNPTSPIVVKPNTTSVRAEQFRLIRTNLPFILGGDKERVLLVTSTVKGEGKSFVSCNLALSLALLNKKVVLVGLDIRSPKLTEYLNIKAKGKGVTAFLASDKCTFDELVIHEDFYPNLDILHAGAVPPNPGELLMSSRLDALFEELRSRYDYVIVDSAPVAPVGDTYNLSRVIDATVYVTRANYSHKDNLEYVNKAAQSGKLKKVSLVVNGTKPASGSSVYGYGHGKSNDTQNG